jgi:hypothetical protein
MGFVMSVSEQHKVGQMLFEDDATRVANLKLALRGEATPEQVYGALHKVMSAREAGQCVVHERSDGEPKMTKVDIRSRLGL